MSDDAWGCVVAVAVIAGGFWLYNHYELKPKKAAGAAAPELSLPRPTGLLEVTETQSGSIWRLNADSVRGDRKHRQGWIIVDASKDKSVTNWRFHHVLYLVDCDTTAIRELSQIFYDAKGETPWPTESKDPKDVEPEYYPEGTVGYAPVRALCDEAFDQPKTQ